MIFIYLYNINYILLYDLYKLYLYKFTASNALWQGPIGCVGLPNRSVSAILAALSPTIPQKRGYARQQEELPHQATYWNQGPAVGLLGYCIGRSLGGVSLTLCGMEGCRMEHPQRMRDGFLSCTAGPSWDDYRLWEGATPMCEGRGWEYCLVIYFIISQFNLSMAVPEARRSFRARDQIQATAETQVTAETQSTALPMPGP